MEILRGLVGHLPPTDITAVICCGLLLFGASWILPRRTISLPDGARSKTLAVIGIGGGMLLLVASISSIVLSTGIGADDPTGYSGWWIRPLALTASSLVLLTLLIAVMKEQRPLPGTRAITARAAWHDSAPRGLGAALISSSGFLALTVIWQIASATVAPPNAEFYGRTWQHNPLPVWISFNKGNGYIAGAGWPNHLATAILLLVTLGLLLGILWKDSRRPRPQSESLSIAKLRRTATARIATALALAGSLSALGAVWVFVGFNGRIIVGLDYAQHSIFFGSSYADLAGPMQFLGLAFEAIAIAILLRLIVDTIRAARAQQPSTAPIPELAS